MTKGPAELKHIIWLWCEEESSSYCYRHRDILLLRKEIEKVDDPKRKKVMMAELDEEKLKATKQWLGSFRFINEL